MHNLILPENREQYDDPPDPYPAGNSLHSRRYLQDQGNAPITVLKAAENYGLIYTVFEISDVRLSSSALTCDRPITATVTVINSGQAEGSEVIQLYIQDMTASVVRPLRELKGFTKLSLSPEESRQVHFSVTEEMLRFHNSSGAYVSEDGLFRLWTSNSSMTGNLVCLYALLLLQKHPASYFRSVRTINFLPPPLLKICYVAV